MSKESRPVPQGKERSVKERWPSDVHDIAGVDQGYVRSPCTAPDSHPGFLDGSTPKQRGRK